MNSGLPDESHPQGADGASAGTTRNDADARTLRFAMTLSLVVGLLMLWIKAAAYLLTGSAAILSDAAESVVHVAAVSFAFYSLQLSQKPADEGWDAIYSVV